MEIGLAMAETAIEIFADLPPGRYIVVPFKPELDFAPRYEFVDLKWAQKWPSEEIWIAHKAS